MTILVIPGLEQAALSAGLGSSARPDARKVVLLLPIPGWHSAESKPAGACLAQRQLLPNLCCTFSQNAKTFVAELWCVGRLSNRYVDTALAT
jgi:hypothetical protein